jgi:hypothetical protein
MRTPGHDHPEGHHPHNRHLAEKFEGYIGIAAVAAIVLLAIVLIYGLATTGSSTPSWMR